MAQPTTSMGRQPLREELYVERLIASLAYHRTAEESMTVTACREMQQLVATPERLFFLLNHPHFQAKGLVVLTSLLEDPLSAKAHAAISVLSDLASDTQGASALLHPKVMTMDPFAVVAMAYTAIGKLIIANTGSDDHSVRACWDAVHVLHMLVPQPRGFTALQQLPLEEFRIVTTALIETTQRRWPSAETGAVEKNAGSSSGAFFSLASGFGGDGFEPRGTHPMDHSVAEEGSMVLQFVAEQLAGAQLADVPKYQDPVEGKTRLQAAMLFFHRCSAPEVGMERPDVTPWLVGLHRDLTKGSAAVQGVAVKIVRAIMGGKELTRVLMAGGSPEQTKAAVALIGCMLTRDSALAEDIFHATRAACRIGAYEDAHQAFIALVPSREVEALIHGLACVILEAIPVDSRGSPAAAVNIFNTNKQAAATMCSAAEAMKLLLGGALGVELVTALLESKTEEQIEKERSGGILGFITGGLLTGVTSKERPGCTSEDARVAITTTAYFALLCVTAVPSVGAFAAEALHALSCCPAGADLLLRQPTPLLTCGIQGLIPMLHPDNTALVFAVEVIAGCVADPQGILAFRGLPQPEAISLMTRLQAVSSVGSHDPVSSRCTWAASNTLKILVAEGFIDAYLPR